MAEAINEWVFSFRDDENFIASSRKGIWGMTETRPIHTHFIKTVKEGDILWFKSKGKLIAAARHKKVRLRENGPLISLDYTNAELGWNYGEGTHLIFYDELYD